ncbi:MAG: TRAP transporter substrate-binding protein [Spirochaetales bacterium]|nr:TRAP transporter substrate-binding protein [Spirochaetales bacterium]
MKSTWIRISLILILALVISTAGVFAAGSQDEEAGEIQYNFKYANQQPEGHSRTVSMLWFEKEIEARTDGRIQMEVFHSGVLGTEKEMFEMAVTGAIQGFRGAFYDQLNPQFLLYNLPFLFQSYEEMIVFNASDMAADMLEKGSVQGIYMPAVGYTGFRAVMNNKRPIMLPEDLKGIKMRAPGQAPIINFYKLFDASPQEMAFSEVYMAIKQGVVDGGDNSPSNIDAAKLYEVSQYFTALNYMAGADPLMVNMDWYKTLPADLQDIFNEVSKEALAYWDQLEKDATQESVNKLMTAPGVEGINMENQPAEAAIWEKACEPLWQQFVDAGYFSWDDIKRAQEIIATVR